MCVVPAREGTLAIGGVPKSHWDLKGENAILLCRLSFLIWIAARLSLPGQAGLGPDPSRTLG